MPLGKADIAAMIPHAGRMCLLGEVVDWDADTIRCRAWSHRDPDNPLRAASELPALCGVEYAAQAMAVHGRLSEALRERPRAGYIAAVSDLECRVRRLDDVAGDLVIRARRLAGDEARVLYGFDLYANGQELLQGRASVVLDAAP